MSAKLTIEFTNGSDRRKFDMEYNVDLKQCPFCGNNNHISSQGGSLHLYRSFRCGTEIYIEYYIDGNYKLEYEQKCIIGKRNDAINKLLK